MYLKLPLALLLLFYPVYALRCEKSIDCNDNLPCSLDFCEPLNSRCINLSREPQCNSFRREINASRLTSFVNRNPISLGDRLRIIQRIAKVLDGFHPHRILHLRFLKVDPVRLLFQLAKELKSGTFLSNTQFHERTFDIIQRLNDLHTIYLAPPPLSSGRAFLPFTIKEYYTNSGDRRFVVTDIGVGTKFTDPAFSVGSEIIKWDELDIEEAIRLEGERGYGSNPAAQFANGLINIRAKFLSLDPAPVRSFVEVGFITSGGEKRSMRVDWIFAAVVSEESLPFFQEDPDFPGNPIIVSSREAPEFKMDTRGSAQDSEMAFQRQQLDWSETLDLSETTRQSVRRRTLNVSSEFCGLFGGEIIETESGNIGRLILNSFSLADFDFFGTLAAFEGLLSQFPQRGLIVDIRGNPGGLVILAQLYTELLTSGTFEVPNVKIRATDLLDRIVNTNFSMMNEPFGDIFSPIQPAMRTARLAGDPYVGSMSFGFDFNRPPAAYNGPYVVLGDGLTYSSGDIFTAIHADHNLAPVVLIGENVGAGGSTVRNYEQLSDELSDEFAPLPAGAGFTTSTFRIMRTGSSGGAILENFGVEPDVVYKPTLRDRLEDDVDLFEFLADMVATRR